MITYSFPSIYLENVMWERGLHIIIDIKSTGIGGNVQFSRKLLSFFNCCHHAYNILVWLHYYDILIYVTGFGKMCIVHTSDFTHLAIHTNPRKWYTDMKLSGIIKE